MKRLITLTAFFLLAFNLYAQQKPNIIFILADDMGYGDVSALNKESKINTPAIDKLIREGMSFTDAHTASSVCTPSRYGLLTGRYPWRSPLKAGVLGLYAPPLINSDKLTIGKLLQQQGYTTACIGKWHLGWDWPLQNGSFFRDSLYKGHNNEQVRIQLANQINFAGNIIHGPTERGFDYYFGTDVPNYPPYEFIENNKMVRVPDSQKPADMYGHAGPMTSGWQLENILPALGEKASAYVKEKATGKLPFFLYVPLTSPHAPIAPSNEFKNTSKASFYGDYVQETDWVVSEVVKAVEQAGIADNTIIIFSSDNGSPATDGEDMYGKLFSIYKFGHNPSAGYRGIKADIYEGGHHVPFVVRWPSKIKANAHSNATICLTDFMATVADLLDVKLKDDEAEDSYSLLPLLEGKTKKFKRNYTVHYSSGGYFAIRKGKWKLIMGAGSGGWSFPKPSEEKGLPEIQLYDLQNDSTEKNNVQANYPDVVKDLKATLIACIRNGRSTKGAKQKNDGKFLNSTEKWLSLKINNSQNEEVNE